MDNYRNSTAQEAVAALKKAKEYTDWLGAYRAAWGNTYEFWQVEREWREMFGRQKER